jgi:hypothetical protein
LDSGQGSVSNAAVGVRVVVFANEDALGWIAGLECYDVVDDPDEAPSIDHFHVAGHVNAQVDKLEFTGEGVGKVLGQAVFENSFLFFVQRGLLGDAKRLD